MRMVPGPVRAKVTFSTSPTDRCLVLAVVVSISSWPDARAGSPEPDCMRRLMVSAMPGVVTPPRDATDDPRRNWPMYTEVTAVTPGIDAAVVATEALNPVDG